MAELWTQRFDVRTYELDPSGRLSVTSLCDYCQEAAGMHSRVMGISIGDLGRNNLTWVLGRLELEIDHMPRWRDELTVTTWPARHRSYFVVRDFLIEDEHRVLARATSTWFVIDLERRRAVRVPEAVRSLPLPDRERAREESWAKLPRPEVTDRSARFTVRHGDLDENAHVNHVRYLEWALETLDREFHAGHRLTEVAIDFLAELGYGDTVSTAAQLIAEGDSTTLLSSVLGERDGVEAARVRALFRPA